MPKEQGLPDIKKEKDRGHGPEKDNHQGREFGQREIFLFPYASENYRSQITASVQAGNGGE
jgi:hypothetical protein